MKRLELECDIEDTIHIGKVSSIGIYAVFDHDQNDGKEKTEPYFDEVSIEMCDGCRGFMFENLKSVYAYGAMGHNKYYLKANLNKVENK